jgi:hypothetical protein
MSNSDYVWYACYGSNLSYKRFLCYIQGGRPEGSLKIHSGCRDKNPPIEIDSLKINYELFFARKSKSWGGGGVAFINPFKIKNKKSTICKTYLISKQQFEDVLKQENDTEYELNIDFNDLIKQKTLYVLENGWYSVILFLGYKFKFPVFTITCGKPLPDITIPSEGYLKNILKGLKELSIDKSEAARYLIEKNGINNYYSNADLDLLIKEM